MKKILLSLLLLIGILSPLLAIAAVSNSALLVLASSQRFTRADTASLSITSDFTLEAWVKFTTLPSVSASMQCIVSKFDSSAFGGARGDWELCVNTSNQLEMVYSSDGTYNAGKYTQQHQTTATMTSPGVWYHVKGTAVLATHTITLYINGASVPGTDDLVAATTLGDQNYDSTLGSRKGAAYDTFLNGRLFLVRVWSNVHSADDKCVVFGSTSNLAAEWTLDNTVNDNSGNANTLTNVNSITFGADLPSCFSSTIFHQVLINNGAQTIVNNGAQVIVQ